VAKGMTTEAHRWAVDYLEQKFKQLGFRVYRTGFPQRLRYTISGTTVTFDGYERSVYGGLLINPCYPDLWFEDTSKQIMHLIEVENTNKLTRESVKMRRLLDIYDLLYSRGWDLNLYLYSKQGVLNEIVRFDYENEFVINPEVGQNLIDEWLSTCLHIGHDNILNSLLHTGTYGSGIE
jgi:hypothetical protein